MKKYIVFLLLLSGCSVQSQYYSDIEVEILKKYEVYDIAETACTNKETLKYMLNDEFDPSFTVSYCSIKVDTPQHINTLLNHRLKDEEVQTYLENSNFKIELLERYLVYDGSIEEQIYNVNLNLDQEPYSNITIINDTKDVTLLVNKHFALPEGYLPTDLVDISIPCSVTNDFSCTLMNKQELRLEAATALDAFGTAAMNEGLVLISIASYRSYEYQSLLYNNALSSGGLEFADAYYARPGQSEHNSGLAVDLTYSGFPYNQIHTHPNYDWMLQNAHIYGFTLRYPEDKTSITGYAYESWHFRYVGADLATFLFDNNLTLEEYYAFY